MKVIPSSVAAVIAGLPASSFTLAKCLRLVLRDGTTYGFTDHDQALVVDGVTYQPGEGLIPGDMDLSTGFNAGNVEIAIPVGTLVTRAAVLGRRFNHADAYFFDVDWSVANPDVIEWAKGQINDARIDGDMAVFEVRSQSDYWNVTIGEVLSPRCAADFGDFRCKLAKVAIAATITAVESSLRFTVNLGTTYGVNWFRFGTAQFTSGVLAGVWPMDIVAYDGAGAVEVFIPMPAAPAIGDTVNIFRGCSRLKEATDPNIATCVGYSNVVNFRGYDRVPGSDVYLRFPLPTG